MKAPAAPLFASFFGKNIGTNLKMCTRGRILPIQAMLVFGEHIV
jgi:hypothetical protein